MNVPIAVLSVGTATPQFRYSPFDIAVATNEWLIDEPDKRAVFERFLSSSNVKSRAFALPLEEVLALNGLHGRHLHFEREGPLLGEIASRIAIEAGGISLSQIDTLIFTSCSCPSIPCIDALLMELLQMRSTTNRIPLYQHGCAGGVVGLGIASRLASAGQRVLLSSVELCSLVFHRDGISPAELVGSAIFGDGAASVVVGPADSGLIFIDHQSLLLAETRHLMGYETLDDGFHLRLSRELPQVLGERVPEQVREFLARFGLSEADVPYWLFHPGGTRILDLLETAFQLQPAQCSWARDVLEQNGNLSSATVLFVLDRFLNAGVVRDGQHVLMIGVGPGLTLELILFRYKGQ